MGLVGALFGAFLCILVTVSPVFAFSEFEEPESDACLLSRPVLHVALPLRRRLENWVDKIENCGCRTRGNGYHRSLPYGRRSECCQVMIS